VQEEKTVCIGIIIHLNSTTDKRRFNNSDDFGVYYSYIWFLHWIFGKKFSQPKLFLWFSGGKKLVAIRL